MSFVYICCVSLFVDHVYFLWLKLQSKTLIQSQMVESSVHSCVVWINQTPDIHIKPGIRLNQLKVFHIFYLYLFGITSSFLSPVPLRMLRRVLLRLESRIHDRYIGKIPFQGSIPMRTQIYTHTYPNLNRVQRSINNKINFII